MDTVEHTTRQKPTINKHQQPQRMRQPHNRMRTQLLSRHPKLPAIKLPNMWLDRHGIIFNHNKQRQMYQQPPTMQIKDMHRSQTTHRMHQTIQRLNVISFRFNHMQLSSSIIHQCVVFVFFFFLLAPASTTTQSNYSSYDAALYSAATMYVAQQTNKQPVCNG